jgi:hypothetical protein
MPLQFPNLANIAAPMQSFQPQSVSSVLMEIAKERRDEERLTLDKIAEARQQEQQRLDEAERTKKNLIENAKIRADQQKQQWSEFNDMVKAGEYTDAQALSDKYKLGMTIDAGKSVVEYNGITMEMHGEGKNRAEYADWMMERQKDTKNPLTQEEIIKYAAEHNLDFTYKTKDGTTSAKTSTAFNDVRTMYPDLDPRSKEFAKRFQERLWNPETGGSAGKEMAALKQQFPYLSDDQLTKLSYGHIIMGQDALGNPILIDRIDNKTIPIQQPSRTSTVAQPAQTSGFQITPETARAGTGPAAKIKEKINNLFGWMTEGVPFADTSESREALRIFNQHLKLSFVNNPRVPIAEQTTVQGFLPDPDKTFRDPDESVNKLRQLKDFLITKRNEKENLIDRGNISAKQIAEYTSQINDIDLALSMMVTVGQSNIPTITNQAEYDAVTKGQRYKDAQGNIRIKQ